MVHTTFPAALYFFCWWSQITDDWEKNVNIYDKKLLEAKTCLDVKNLCTLTAMGLFNLHFTNLICILICVVDIITIIILIIILILLTVKTGSQNPVSSK